jgi:hypothetical protein
VGCSQWNKHIASLDSVFGRHVEVLKWSRANGCDWNSLTCAYLAENGDLEALKWAVANGLPSDDRTCSAAATYGNLELLQWARANGCPWDEMTCENACFGGHCSSGL